jgi:hypothetical protein
MGGEGAQASSSPSGAEKLMSMDSNEATSLLIQVLNLADPNPPAKAAERVQQIRELLGVPKAAEVKKDDEKKRKKRGGHDRQESGGNDREET